MRDTEARVSTAVEALKDARADLADWRAGLLTLAQYRADPPDWGHDAEYLSLYRRYRDAMLARWYVHIHMTKRRRYT